tara:strand:- start:3137 stop:3988 length:852 start_codon:yes stop_codon:yes gene_type:complete
MLNIFDKIFKTFFKYNKRKFRARYDFFNDSILNDKLDKSSFVTIPFLDEEEVTLITNYIREKTPLVSMAKDNGFVPGVTVKSKEEKKDLDLFLRNIIEPKLNSVAEDFKVVIFTILIKAFGENSKLDVHQDWSIVDESKYASYSLWIPLIDSTIENGAIQIVEGSHKKFDNIRGGSILSVLNTNEKFTKQMKQMKPIEMKKGELLILNQRAIHYSPANTTNKMRFSAIGTVVPKEAEIFLYYQKDKKNLEVYKMKEDFFFDYDDFILEKGQKPKGEKVGEIKL